eukprot:2101034-Pyramimonas_sp.AAC.1
MHAGCASQRSRPKSRPSGLAPLPASCARRRRAGGLRSGSPSRATPVPAPGWRRAWRRTRPCASRRP